MKNILLILLCSTFIYGQTLDILLEKAKAQNLLLSKNADNIMIGDEQVELANTWDNPTLILGANDLLIDDITSRNREPMQTQYITLSQKIPTNGKIALQKNIALVQRDISEAIYNDTLQKITSSLNSLAYKVTIIEKKIALIKKYQYNVTKLKQLYIKHLEVGKSTQRATLKSKILAKKLLIKKRKLLSMKKALLYKIEKLVYEKISSVEVPMIMDKENIINLKKHPIIIIATLKAQKAKENLKLQHANKIPDIKLGIGYFQRESRSDYLALNVGINLPVRGREERSIKMALLKENQAQKELKSKIFTIQKEVEILKELMDDSLANYKIIKKEILPKQRYIQKLLQREILTKNSSVITLLQNLNETIILELEAYDEMDSYFDAYSKLIYFKGELS